MSADPERPKDEQDTEDVDLGALAPGDLGEPRDDEDVPPAEETRTPYDEG